jgi:hypothetical protein
MTFDVASVFVGIVIGLATARLIIGCAYVSKHEQELKCAYCKWRHEGREVHQ